MFNNKTVILGGQAGQYGDIILNTVVAKAIKQKFPNSHYIYGISKKYWDIHELFLYHPHIDNLIQWEGYDDFPTQRDIESINNIKPDIFLYPMASHPNNHCWYRLVNSLTESACIMQGFVPPEDKSCYLNRYFDLYNEYSNFVCISPFTSWKLKNISNEKWQRIINFICKNGYKVIQIGAKEEFQFNNVIKLELSYFESVKTMLSCKFLITLDTGMNWVASAYNHPVLALFGLHFPGIANAKIYQPLNKNGHYLESVLADDIAEELIFEKIKFLLNTK